MTEMGHNHDLDVEFEDLQAEVNELSQLAKSQSEQSGKLRSRLKSILDQRGYHPKAMATIRTIDAMSLTQRNDFLRSFEPMFDAMISNKWRDEQQDLFDHGEESNDG